MIKMNYVRKFLHTRLLLAIFNFNNFLTCNRRMLQGPIRKPTFMTITTLAFIWPVKKTIKTDQKMQDTFTQVLENADQLFETGHYEECYQMLLNVNDETNVEIQWRIVRVMYNMSKEPKYEKSYKKELVFNAYNIIAKLVESYDNNFAVHKWYALLLDAKTSYEGTKARIQQLENVKKHMDLAVTLNPNDATCLHILGEWCYQITEMPWHQRKIAEVIFASPPLSSYEDALEYFLRAETVQPRFYSLNLLRIGNCYLKLQREDLAEYYLQLAASYPAKSNDDHRANKEAAELLKKLNK